VLFNARVGIVNELDMSEGEVTHFSIQLSFPLTIDGHLGDFHNVANVQSERSAVVGVGNSGLFDTSESRKFALKK
jgi:hypothetical protein